MQVFRVASAEIARAGRRAMPMARATPMAMSSQSLTSVDGGGADDTAATCASLFSPPTQPRAPQSEHRDATQCVQTISRPILKAHLRPTLLARGAAAAHPTPISASCAARAARYWRGSGRSVCACLEAGALLCANRTPAGTMCVCVRCCVFNLINMSRPRY